MDLARRGPGISPIHRQHFAAKENIGTFHFGETRDGRAARAVQSRQKPAFAGNGEMGFRIVDGLDVPIVPVCLDRVWGSIFSFKGGRFFWKWPVRVPYPVTVAFGRPLP